MTGVLRDARGARSSGRAGEATALCLEIAARVGVTSNGVVKRLQRRGVEIQYTKARRGKLAVVRVADLPEEWRAVMEPGGAGATRAPARINGGSALPRIEDLRELGAAVAKVVGSSGVSSARAVREVERRAALVVAWESRKRLGLGNLRAVLKAIRAYGRIAYGTARRWLREYAEQGMAALMPSARGRKVGEVDEGFWAIFAPMYLNENCPAFESAYRRAVDYCRAAGSADGQVAAPFGSSARGRAGAVEIPTARVLRRYVDDTVSMAERVRLREGERAWGLQAVPSIMRDPDAQRAGEVWNLDCHTLDVFVRNDAGRVFRPTLSAFIDFRSWRFLGARLTEHFPDAEGIVKLFGQAVRHVDMCLPRGIYADNGREAQNKRFGGAGRRGKGLGLEERQRRYADSVLGRLGVEATWAIPRNSRAKPIERFFRQICEEWSRHQRGYAGSNTAAKPAGLVDRGGYEAAEVMHIDEARESLTRHLLHVHANRPMGGVYHKGQTPAEVWGRNLGVLRHVSEATLAAELMQVVSVRRVGALGVCWRGRYYFAEEFVARGMLGREVELRVDPENHGALLVCNPKTGERLCLASAVVPVRETAEAIKAQKRARRAARQHVAGLVAYVRDNTLDPREVDAAIARLHGASGAGEALKVPVVRSLEMERKAAERAAREAEKRAKEAEAAKRRAESMAIDAANLRTRAESMSAQYGVPVEQMEELLRKSA